MIKWGAMKFQPASTQSRSIVRSLWLTALNLAVGLLVWGWASVAIAQVYRLGDEGTAVEAIQRRLDIEPDGIFGTVTESAVITFQQLNSLEADGIVGPQTLEALGLNYLITEPRQLPYGSSSAVGFSTPLESRTNPYVVVIPGNNLAELYQVRQLISGAEINPSRLGAYIRAGAFPRRSQAESLSRDLRRAGFDARVAYRP